MKILLLLAVMLFTFSACRKKELIDTDVYDYMTFVYDDPKCSNGILDSLESFIDCGGPCAPCPTVSTPCITVKNELTAKFNTTTIAEYAFDDAEVFATMNANGSYQVLLVRGNEELTFTFGAKMFGQPCLVAKSDYVYFVNATTETFHVNYFRDGQNRGSYTNKNCFVNYIDGKYSIGFCNLSIANELYLTGNITFSI